MRPGVYWPPKKRGKARALKSRGLSPKFIDGPMIKKFRRVWSDYVRQKKAGAWAAHVPYPLTWAHEMADAPTGHPRFTELSSISEFPAWVKGLG